MFLVEFKQTKKGNENSKAQQENTKFLLVYLVPENASQDLEKVFQVEEECQGNQQHHDRMKHDRTGVCLFILNGIPSIEEQWNNKKQAYIDIVIEIVQVCFILHFL